MVVDGGVIIVSLGWGTMKDVMILGLIRARLRERRKTGLPRFARKDGFVGGLGRGMRAEGKEG
jgi:hypothetical protein